MNPFEFLIYEEIKKLGGPQEGAEAYPPFQKRPAAKAAVPKQKQISVAVLYAWFAILMK